MTVITESLASSEPWPLLPEGQFAGSGHPCGDCGASQGGKLELCDAGAGRKGDDGWYRGRWHLHADLRPEVAGSDDREPFALRQAWRASAYDLCGSGAGVWKRDVFRSHGA